MADESLPQDDDLYDMCKQLRGMALGIQDIARYSPFKIEGAGDGSRLCLKAADEIEALLEIRLRASTLMLRYKACDDAEVSSAYHAAKYIRTGREDD